MFVLSSCQMKRQSDDFSQFSSEISVFSDYQKLATSIIFYQYNYNSNSCSINDTTKQKKMLQTSISQDQNV